MNNVSGGLFIIALGILSIVFRKPLADNAVGFQIRAFRFSFGQKKLDTTYRMVCLIGVLVIVVGVLTIFGVFKK